MISEFNVGRELEIHNLIKSVYDEFVGYEYSEEGNTIFYDFIKPENISDRVRSGNIIHTYIKNDRIIGMIEVRDYSHICLFFVSKNNHNKGTGRKLFNSILNKIKHKTSFIDVNASPFSEAVYKKLGFVKTGEKTVKNGMIFIPMKYNLKLLQL